MNFKNKTGSIKIIIPIFIIIILAIIAFFVIDEKAGNRNALLEMQENIPYEYFVMYSKDNKAGVIDRNGNILIEPKYSDIYIPNQSKDVFFCLQDDENFVLNKDGNEIFTEFEEVSYLETSEATELILEKKVLRYKKDGLYGLINFKGEILTEPIYEKVTSLKNKPGNILVKKDGECGVLNSDGDIIIPIKYDTVVGDEYCQEKYGYTLTGYIVSLKTDTGIIYGYIDYMGNEMLKPEYETITRVLEYDDTDDIYIIVRNQGKKGVFKNGKQIIDFNYQAINYSDKSNIFVVEKAGKYGFFNQKGDEILEPKYTKYDIAGNYISVQENENNMLYDLNGNLINKDTYLSMIEVENSSYFIAENEEGYYNIISKDYQTTEKYTYITYAFDDNFIFINEENKSGVLNIFKGTVIEPNYTSILNMEGTKLIEARNDETGDVDIYNYELKKISTISGGIVEKVNENYIVIYSESEMMYFDNNGEIVENTEVFPDNKLYTIKQNDKWGYIDKEGKIIVQCQYDIVTELNEYGFAGIKQEGKWGVINENGEIVIEPTYELETYYFPNFVGKYQVEYIETKHCIER